MTYTTAIVEDEKHQQEMLLALLADFPEIKIVGTAASMEEGRLLLQTTKPDLVFLDVMIPPHTSFDLLSWFSHFPFEIIFTTSYEEYAVKAFRLAAVDYLLKPVLKSDLADAIEKFKRKRSVQENAAHIQTLLQNINLIKNDHAKVALPTLGGFIFVMVKDIIRCEADNTYSTFYTIDKRKIVVSKTLKECELILTGFPFFRIHNSHLINLDYIVEYKRGEGGSVRMTDGSLLDVSRRKKEQLMFALKRN
jgi:two-component system LytT family response regulator